MEDAKAPQDAADGQESWLESRLPLREEYMCARAMEYLIEWDAAGRPMKDRREVA